MAYVRAALALHQGDDTPLLSRADLEAEVDHMLAGATPEDLSDRELANTLTVVQFLFESLLFEWHGRHGLRANGEVLLPYQSTHVAPTVVTRRQ